MAKPDTTLQAPTGALTRLNPTKLDPGSLQATARLPAKQDLQEELRAVVPPGEAEHFLKQGDRIRADVSAKLKHDAVRPATVDLPPTAEGFVRIQADGGKAGIEFAAKGSKAGIPLETADGLVNYPGAAPGGGDMVLRVGRETVEDFVVLDAKPEQAFIDYRVKVSEVAGLRLYDNTLEFLSASGNPEVRVSPPDLVDADGVGHPAQLTLTDCMADSNPAAPWDRPVTAPGASECTLRVSWDDARVVYPAIVDPVWSAAGSLAKGRYRNAGVKMSNGNVITCGGLDINGDGLKSCEIYNPATNAWATGPSLNQTRSLFTLIAVGTDILAVGDQTSATSELCNCTSASPAWTATATNFSTGSFSLSQLEPALTADGAYVVVVDNYGAPFAYKVSTKAWTAGTSNTIYRYNYSVIAVPGGSAVLRCGGYDGVTALKTCEKYTPSTNVWIMPGSAGAATNMIAGRSQAAWASIDATHVMLYGGYNGQSGTSIQSAEIYNGATNVWADAGAIPNQLQEYEMHNTWALHGGTNKIISDAGYGFMVYDPVASTWTQLSNYDGTAYFYAEYYGEGALVSAGSKVLVAPVTPNGSNSAQTACKLFDFVAQGGTCQQASDCKSGLTCYYDDKTYTSDGLSVCCDTTCTDPCYSCRAQNKQSGTGEGTCGPRATTAYVGYAADRCPSTSYTSCGTTGGYCDGKGACAVYDATTICAYSSCSDIDTQNNQRNCDGKGNCTALTTTDCQTGYDCVYNSACATSCSDDSACAANYFCQYWNSPAATQFTCQPRKAAGKTCTNFSTTECASSNCVDGFCCDTACNGSCEACSNALTTKTNGVCSPIPSGQASNKDCIDQGSASCGQTGLCNGARACQKYASGTQCADIGSCASETSRYVPDQCDGNGLCVDKGTAACNTGYSCQAGACNTSCTSDANCASAYFCDTVTKTCVPDHKQSQSCKSDSQCEGNADCVDGVCCDSACTGDCQSCLKVNTGLTDGTCGSSLDDTDPRNKCTQGAAYPNSCAAPGLCNGQGACRPYAKQGVECDTDVCSDSTLTTYGCNGAGTCKATSTQCYPFKCDTANNVCRVACSIDAHCVGGGTPTGSHCENGSCVGQLAGGQACTRGAQCGSGFCANIGEGVLQGQADTGAGGDGAGGAAGVDPGANSPGVCCDTACQGTCSGCKASIKGFGSDGVCEFVKNNTDPANDCQKSANDACGLDGQCNGSGACRLAPSGTSCGASTCQGNSVLGQSCDGAGDCINNQGGVDCAPYVCRDVSGAFQCTNPCTEDNDCQDGYYCSDAACKKKLSNSKACDNGTICASGYCIDGVCCDTSCNGQCEACDAAGSEGTCTPVKGEPHGMRTACDHAKDECGGQCDGVNAASCKYAANGDSCGTPTCDNGVAKSSICNGQGECKANKDASCSPYTCGTDDTCLTLCEQDADCGQGYACDTTTQRCLPSAVAASCSDDRLTSNGQNGNSTPCKPFLCVPASGTCAVSCAFTTDCAPDFVCEPSTKTCLPAPADTGTSNDSSCACRAAGGAPTRSGYLALAALGTLLTGLRRRKRSRKSSPSSGKPRGFAKASHPFE